MTERLALACCGILIIRAVGTIAARAIRASIDGLLYVLEDRR